MTRVAQLDVQLIGHTVFTPPVDAAGDDLFVPDEANDISVGPFDVHFDGQALAEMAGRLCYMSFDRPNAKTASNADYLLNILRQKHGSVLEHASVSFLVQGVSRSLTHEFERHRHFSYSEMSQRYVDAADLKIVVPPAFAEAMLNDPDEMEHWASKTAERALLDYNANVRALKATRPDATKKQRLEAARSVLPNSTETKLVVTGNYRAWIEFLVKRDNPAADAEIQRLAREIGRLLDEHAPNVFGAEARAVWDDSAAQEPAREVTA